MPIAFKLSQIKETEKDNFEDDYIVAPANTITLKDGKRQIEKPLTIRHNGMLYSSGEKIRLAYKFAKHLFRGEKPYDNQKDYHYNPYASCDVIIPLKKFVQQLKKDKEALTKKEQVIASQIEQTEQTIDRAQNEQVKKVNNNPSDLLNSLRK